MTKESDWSDYYGSNETLKKLVAKEAAPEQRFKREIIHLCRTASELNYLESKAIFEADALLSDDYYNDYIICRINSKHIKTLKRNSK